MGTSKSVGEFQGKLKRASALLEHNNRDTLLRAAKECKRLLDATIAAEVGGDMTASNAPRRGKPGRMSAAYGVLTGTAVARVKVGPRGPVALIDQGAGSHLVGVGRGKASTGKAKRTHTDIGGLGRSYNLGNEDRAMRIGGTGEWRTGPFIHPGTVGKRRWTKTRDQVLPRVLRPIIMAPMTSSLARAFR